MITLSPDDETVDPATTVSKGIYLKLHYAKEFETENILIIYE